MELAEVIRERRSIRAFRDEQVPKETIAGLLRLATRAPSAINLQPWEFTVVMDEERKRLSRRLIKSYRERMISCSPGNVKPMPKVFSARGTESFEGMKGYIEEAGSDFSTYINEGSCNFYGAPVALVVCIDEAFSAARLVDIGICLGYLVLAAHTMGLSTCPIGLVSAYEDEVKDALNIPDTKNLVLGVAVGYPDLDHPVNRFISSRSDLREVVRWIEGGA
jgi:nitroreductase